MATDAPTPDASTPGGTGRGRSIVAGGASRLLGFLFGSVAAIVAIPLIARHLGAGEFGRYTAVISLITVSTVVSDLGLSTLAVRDFASAAGAERAARFRALLALRLMLATVTGVAMVAYVAIVGFGPEVVLGTACAAVGVVALAAHASWNAALQATMQLHRLAVLESARLFLIAALGAVVALAGGGFGLLTAVYLPAGLIMAGASAWAVRGAVPLLPSWDAARMRAMLRAVVAFAVAATIGSLYAYLAQVLVERLVSDDAASAFSLSFRLMIAALGAAMTAISGAFAPMSALAAGKDPAFQRLTNDVLRGALVFGAFGAIGASALAGPLVDAFGGSAYEGARPILEIHAFSLPGAFFVYAGTLALLALHAHRQMLVIAVVGLTCTMGVTAALALADAGRGAAIASVVSETVFASAVLVALHRRAPSALPSAAWFARFLAALAVAGVVAHVGLPSVVATVAALLVLTALVVVLRLLPVALDARLRALARVR